jgi:hypothetical protein
MTYTLDDVLDDLRRALALVDMATSVAPGKATRRSLALAARDFLVMLSPTLRREAGLEEGDEVVCIADCCGCTRCTARRESAAIPFDDVPF